MIIDFKNSSFLQNGSSERPEQFNLIERSPKIYSNELLISKQIKDSIKSDASYGLSQHYFPSVFDKIKVMLKICADSNSQALSKPFYKIDSLKKHLLIKNSSRKKQLKQQKVYSFDSIFKPTDIQVSKMSNLCKISFF